MEQQTKLNGKRLEAQDSIYKNIDFLIFIIEIPATYQWLKN